MKTCVLNNSLSNNHGEEIKEINLRKPMAGELRGIKLLDLIQMDAAAHAQLVPRISEPMMTVDQFYQLQPEDLMTLMVEIVSFFVSDNTLMT